MEKIPTSPHSLPVLLVLFFGSGCAALIYEIVWFQLLQLVIGSTAVSLAVLLGTYMGGMCLGSLALPRLIPVRRHPIRVYALIELGIAILGIVVLFGMPLVVRFYTSAAGGHNFLGILMRGAVCAACLLLPTMLMGATLPAVARWVETTPSGVSWLGFLYGGNIAGAVFGCLLAGFYLLRVYDTATATYTAAGINTAIALFAFGLAARSPHRKLTESKKRAPIESIHGFWAVYVTIAISGLCALGAEVVWTRLLSLMMGATVYTFSIILAVFLAGLGIGSGIGAYITRRNISPRKALGYSQLFLTAAIAWCAFMLARSLPYWSIDPSLPPGAIFKIDLLRCGMSVFPAACLWGASFPLALAAVARPGLDGGRLVARIYASNTVGAIAGAVAFSLFFIPVLGTRQSQRLMIGLSLGAALLILGTIPNFMRRRIVLPAAASVLAFILIWTLPPFPWQLVAYGRYLPKKAGRSSLLYAGEGMNASVAVTETEGGTRNFHISGRVEASSSIADMRMQRLLGHIPGLFHDEPRSVLVVGCGAGVTAGTFVLYPGVERIVICEIERRIPEVVARYFSQENYGVLDDPRVEVIFDDARHYILTSREKFDIITTDPIHPWIKGSAALYTVEYLNLAKKHLNPGGIIVQWVPLYESTLETVKSELATFFEVFPTGTIWSNEVMALGYDVILLGKPDGLQIDLNKLQKRLDKPDYAEIARSLTEIGYKSAVASTATFAGRAENLVGWLKGAEINRDRNLRLQYLAGLGLNFQQNWLIYDELLERFRYPDDLFFGSEKDIRALKKSLGLDK
jgi:spermidine synthase